MSSCGATTLDATPTAPLRAQTVMGPAKIPSGRTRLTTPRKLMRILPCAMRRLTPSGKRADAR